MFKVLTPIFTLLIAIGLLVTYVKPTFDGIKKTQDETADYAQAIDKASQLKARINELVAKQNAFSTTDLERLETMLPDHVDEVALMLDLNALSESNSMTFGNITVEKGTVAPPEPDRAVTSDVVDPAAVNSSATTPGSTYETTDISFTVTGTYDSFRTFLADVERSLVFLDVTKLSITQSEGDLTAFNVTVRAYSFNSNI